MIQNEKRSDTPHVSVSDHERLFLCFDSIQQIIYTIIFPFKSNWNCIAADFVCCCLKNGRDIISWWSRGLHLHLRHTCALCIFLLVGWMKFNNSIINTFHCLYSLHNKSRLLLGYLTAFTVKQNNKMLSNNVTLILWRETFVAAEPRMSFINEPRAAETFHWAEQSHKTVKSKLYSEMWSSCASSSNLSCCLATVTTWTTVFSRRRRWKNLLKRKTVPVTERVVVLVF